MNKIIKYKIHISMKINRIRVSAIGNKVNLIFFFLLTSIVFFSGCSEAPSLKTSGKYYTLEYTPSGESEELQIPFTYTLWVPTEAKTIRGVIVHQHGAGILASEQGAAAATDLHWQALAKKWDCALLGSSYHVSNDATDMTPGGSELWFDPRHGSDQAFQNALAKFAKQTDHQEITKAPWVFWGHSGGGIWSDVMSCLHPERVVAIWLRSGSATSFLNRPEFPQPEISKAVYQIPIMGNAGIKEKGRGAYDGTLTKFHEYRSKGAPIGFAPDPRTGHECGDARYLAIPYLDACMALRLPDKNSTNQTLKPINMANAWFGSLKDSTAVPAKEFKGNPVDAVWLPNQKVARYWEEYIKTGAVSDDTPPPSPTNVQVSDQGDLGTKITWDAEADFESGIRCFVILRNGQVLAKVAKNPYGEYGRPLFQSMSYGDTPRPDMPESKMIYMDNTSINGLSQKYSVLSVNGVGLKSEPSKD
ncbi:MAG: pimeloyl-ACP methyl ester carboxylesterase [Sediminicola sp.]